MESVPCFSCDQPVVQVINNGEVNELLLFDWEKITGGFNAERLQSIVFSIRFNDARIAALRACLTQYKYYLMRTDYALYQRSWETGNAFREFCEAMIRDFEEWDKFSIWKECSTTARTDNETAMAILESDEAMRYMERLEPRYMKGRCWNKNVSKAFICQVAHVLSGLLGVPDSRKWTFFEKYWKVTGLAKAFNGRYGRQLEKEIRDLFPEYKGI